MAAIIRSENIAKRYRIGVGKSSLREALSGLSRRFINRANVDTECKNEFWALRDITFEVEQGEVIGFIGSNGAGKTTMLKLLSRVTKPTTGQIWVGGRVSALIELGAGFHPDLTGRENIFLNGVILGLSRVEIARKFDRIVAFSELGDFIDMPVKRYSSGMYVRLGFAIAAHVDPDILLVDEVLAVGDHQFRVRCMDRFRELQKQGVTTVIVSHNRHLIESLCSRVIFLQRGQIAYDGDPSTAWDTYLAISATEHFGLQGDSDGESSHSQMSITSVEVLDQRGEPRLFFAPGERMQACIRFESYGHVEDPVFYARLYRDGSLVHGTNSARHKVKCNYDSGDRGVAYIDYEALHLLDGTYELSLGIEKSFYSRSSYDRAAPTTITVGGGLEHGVGLVHLKHRWRVADPVPVTHVGSKESMGS